MKKSYKYGSVLCGVLLIAVAIYAQVAGPIAGINGTLGRLPKYLTPSHGTPVLGPSNIGDNGSAITYNGTPIAAGTVTGVSVVTANGISGSSSGGATPALTLALASITPTSVGAGGTKFVVTSGCTNSSTIGGAVAGEIVATSTTCSPVITTGITATTGYICFAVDITTPAATMKETAFTTTTVTFTGASLGGTDTIVFSCPTVF